MNEWGHVSSSAVKARGIKDYAYLILRREGKPMHFRDVAKEINSTFNKKAHVATCHNELIKDKRFIFSERKKNFISRYKLFFSYFYSATFK
jgi:DNA-directed RNA polymerase delta subunit